jgi:polysaccharide biosynthesis protein PslH
MLHPQDREQTPPEATLFEEFLTVRKPRSYTPEMVVKGMKGPVPVTVLNYTSKDIAECLAETLRRRKFDAVQLETSNLFSYLEIIRATPNNPAVLLDWHNIDSELMSRYASGSANPAKRWIARRTANLLSDLETKLMGLCDAHTVVSERDRSKLLERNPVARVKVIPNGVDSHAFAPTGSPAKGKSLLFVGSMDYHANVDAAVWFANDVWPGISERFPSLQFNVVGRSPAQEVRALASERIRISGTVEDVRPYYSDAMAVIVPLRVGGGTRLKILEAMAMGVPVISTKLGAEGIDYRNERDILLADSTEQMIQAVERIMTDSSLRCQLGQAGRRLVSEHYDWTAIGGRLYDVHSELTKTPRVEF